MAYYDLFNEAIDDLATSLGAVANLRVTTDPRNIGPQCAFIDAPSFTTFGGKVVTMVFSVKIVANGPGNLDALRAVLGTAASLLALKIGVISGDPGFVSIGGADYPCYDLTINVQAQAA